MSFHLKRVVDDQMKWLQWFVLGAIHEHFEQMSYSPQERANILSSPYYQDTLNKVVRYLTGKQEADASFSDFQCHVALEARKLFNPTPVGYVTSGYVEYTVEGQLPPNFHNGVENNAT